MNRALCIPELLHSVLFQFEGCVSRFDHDERAALGRAARTCVAWKETALKILWEEMYEMIPLLKLLGPMDCEERDDDRDRYEDEEDEDSEDGKYNYYQWVSLPPRRRSFAGTDDRLHPEFRTNYDYARSMVAF